MLAVPELSRLPARPGLWSPVEGVRGPEDWPARRRTIRAAWRRWLLGPLPPPAAPTRTTLLGVTCEGGVQERRLVLAAGGALLRARLLVPAGARAAPVLLVQSSHDGWARAAVARGMAACVLSAADGDDDSDALAPRLGPARLARRAWALSRALDALHGQPGVDAGRVVVAGHSRNGKAALIAAGFDERFAAVVSSSSGVLGAIPVRRCCDRHFGEGVDLLVRHFPDWYHPRLRAFAGHEHLLPTDAHELLALAAPRPVLVATATDDQVESVVAAREAVALAGEAHALLGAPGAIELALRRGGHGAGAATVETYLDWIGDVLGGGAGRPRPAAAAPERELVPLPRRFFGERLRPVDLPAAVGAVLAPGGDVSHHGPAPVVVAAGPPRPAPRPSLRDSASAMVPGSAPTARPPGTPAPRRAPAAVASRRRRPPIELLGPHGGPAVLWLGPLCRATGWRAGYEQATPLAELLARDGWRVACHDAVGSGTRVDEPGGLAEMLADARATLDRTGPAWLAAYGTGAVVAAHLAALDGRVLGAALVAPTCGERLLAPGRVPAYGLGDLLAAVRPRPLLVLDPRVDPEAPAGAVAGACRAAGVVRVPLRDWHRLSAATREAVREWLGAEGARVRRAA